jgi:uncharacterized membrane protein (UPF0127 family)
MSVRIINVTRGSVVADRAEIANTSEKRRAGLLQRTGLEPGEGLWILPCEAVHCFFMKFTIDVVFLDRQKRVVKLAPNLKPWRMAGSFRARSVVELPAGRIGETGTRVGDEFEIGKPTESPAVSQSQDQSR